MQIKITMRYHFIPVRTGIIKKYTNKNVGEDVKKEPQYTVDGIIIWCNHSGKQLWRWLKKLKIELPCVCLVTQSCPCPWLLCDSMDCSLPGSSVHGDSPGKNTGVGCHALLQGVFPTLGLNPGLPRCRQILYCLSYQGSPELLLSSNSTAYIFKENENANTCFPMFAAALFTIAQIWKQPKCPSTEELIKNMQYKCTM